MNKYILYVSFYSSPTQFDIGRALPNYSSYNLEELKRIADNTDFSEDPDYNLVQNMFLDLQRKRGINSGPIYLEITIHEMTPDGKIHLDKNYGTYAYEFTPYNW